MWEQLRNVFSSVGLNSSRSKHQPLRHLKSEHHGCENPTSNTVHVSVFSTFPQGGILQRFKGQIPHGFAQLNRSPDEMGMIKLYRGKKDDTEHSQAKVRVFHLLTHVGSTFINISVSFEVYRNTSLSKNVYVKAISSLDFNLEVWHKPPQLCVKQNLIY